MRLSTLLLLLGLLAIGYAKKCPKQRNTSPGKEILCYTYSNDVEELEGTICRCTTLVHQGYELHNITTAGVEELQKSLKESNHALQFVISITDPQGTLRTSGTTRQEALGRLANLLSQVDGFELDMSAGSKERLTHFLKGLKDEMVRKSIDKRIILALPTDTEQLAKQYDIKALSKYVDLFTLSTNYLADDTESFNAFHPSRLMGIFDMLNADSLIDLVSGLGVSKKKLLISLPASAYKFTLKEEDKTVPGSPVEEKKPAAISQKELCDLMSTGEWTVERDTDLTAPYAFKDSTWIAYDDKTSVGIKGKYVLLRELAGLGIHDVEKDQKNDCGKPITEEVYRSFTDMKRKTRGAVLASLEKDLQNVEVPHSRHVRASGYRIVRVVDTAGAIHAIRENTQTEFVCTRQGFFVHPKSCNRFYRCVKFDQGVDDFSVFEFDCPAGLAFDERTEVCVWPGSLTDGSPCPGSSEIAPVPRSRFRCPEHPGYYADPENCRWFFACFDLGEPEMRAYEFRCPFGLVFDEEKLTCEWPWLVRGCGVSGYSRTEYGGSGYNVGLKHGIGFGQGSANGGAPGYGDYIGSGIGGAEYYGPGSGGAAYTGSKGSESRPASTVDGNHGLDGLQIGGYGIDGSQFAGQGIGGSGFPGAGGAGSRYSGSGSTGSKYPGSGAGGFGSGAPGSGLSGAGGSGSGYAGAGDAESKYSGSGTGGFGSGASGSGLSGAGGSGSGYAGAGDAGSKYSGSGAGGFGSGASGSGLSGAGGSGSGYAGAGAPGSEYSGSGAGGFGSGSPGSGFTGSGVTGSGFTGAGSAESKYSGLGAGGFGSGAPGSEFSGSGVTGSGYAGAGAPGSEYSGSGAGGFGSGSPGSGFSGSGVTGSGFTGAGSAGSKYSGSGVGGFGSGSPGSGFSGSGVTGSGYAGAGDSDSKYSGPGAGGFGSGVTGSGLSGTGSAGSEYSGSGATESGYSGSGSGGSGYRGAGRDKSRYSGGSGGSYSGAGVGLSGKGGYSSGSGSPDSGYSGQGIGGAGPTYFGKVTPSSIYPGSDTSGNEDSGASEFGTKFSGSRGGSGFKQSRYPSKTGSTGVYADGAHGKPGVVIETVPFPGSGFVSTSGGGYPQTGAGKGSLTGFGSAIGDHTRSGEIVKDGLAISLETGGSPGGVTGPGFTVHSGSGFESQGGLNKFTGAPGNVFATSGAGSFDGQDVINGGLTSGPAILTGTTGSGAGGFSLHGNTGYAGPGESLSDGQDVINGGINSGSVITSSGVTGSGYSGLPVTGSVYTSATGSGVGFSSGPKNIYTTPNPVFSIFGAGKKSPVTPVPTVFLQRVTPGYSVAGSGHGDDGSIGVTGSGFGTRVTGSGNFFGNQPGAGIHGEDYNTGYVTGTVGGGTGEAGGTGLGDIGSSSSVSDTGKGGSSTGTTTHHGNGGFSSTFVSSKTPEADVNGLHGSFLTTGGGSGSISSSDDGSGTIVYEDGNRGSIYGSTGKPGYVNTGSSTPGYVINGVSQTNFGQSTPGTFLTGTAVPGVVLTGTAAAPGYPERTQVTYTGTSGAPFGTKNTGYETNEYHDNGGRGTITYNNGLSTSKHPESDLKPSYVQVPDSDVSGGRIEGTGQVVLGNNLAGINTYTSQGFTKTGPTKTGFTTAQIGGSGSYVTDAGYRRPSSTPTPDNIGSKAFAGQTTASNQGYSLGSSIGSNVNGLAYVTSTVAPDVSHIDTSKINLGYSTPSSISTSGYSYTKPKVQFVTGSVASSTPSPLSVTYREPVSPLTITTPSPHLNIEVYNTPSIVTSAPITAAPAVVNTYTYRKPSSGYRQPLSPTFGTVSTSYQNRQGPGAVGQKTTDYQGVIDGQQQYTVSSTPAPIGYATKPADIYRTTLFQAAKLPATVSSLAPVFDTGYKTVISSTETPIDAYIGQYYYEDSRFGTGTGTGAGSADQTSGNVDGTYRRPSSTYRKPFVSTTVAPANEDGYTYEKPGKQSTYNSPSTVSPLGTFYQQPAVTGGQQGEYVQVSTAAPGFDSGSFRRPSVSIRPALNQLTGSQGYSYSTPNVDFVTPTTPGTVFSVSQGYTYQGSGGSPAKPDISQDKVKELVGNYNRGGVRYTPNADADDGNFGTGFGNDYGSGSFGNKYSADKSGLTSKTYASSTATPTIYQSTTGYTTGSFSGSSGNRGGPFGTGSGSFDGSGGFRNKYSGSNAGLTSKTYVSSTPAPTYQSTLVYSSGSLGGSPGNTGGPFGTGSGSFDGSSDFGNKYSANKARPTLNTYVSSTASPIYQSTTGYRGSVAFTTGSGSFDGSNDFGNKYSANKARPTLNTYVSSTASPIYQSTTGYRGSGAFTTGSGSFDGSSDFGNKYSANKARPTLNTYVSSTASPIYQSTTGYRGSGAFTTGSGSFDGSSDFGNKYSANKARPTLNTYVSSTASPIYQSTTGYRGSGAFTTGSGSFDGSSDFGNKYSANKARPTSNTYVSSTASPIYQSTSGYRGSSGAFNTGSGSFDGSSDFGNKYTGSKGGLTSKPYVSSTAGPIYQSTTGYTSGSSGYRGEYTYSTPLYEVSTARPIAVKGEGKVIVKLSDLHPLLLGKLGAQCTCRSDPFETLRGPGAKSFLIKSSQGPIDLTKYDESQIYVDLEAEREPEQSVAVYNRANGSPTSAPAAYSSSFRTPVSAVFGITTPSSTGFKSRGRPSTAYLPISSTPSSIGELSQDSGAYGSPSDNSDARFAIPPAGFDGGVVVPKGRSSSGKGRTGKSSGVSKGAAAGNAIGGEGAAFDRYGPGGWRNSDETLQGGVDCARSGIFRHPKYCNKFYACHWDDWKQKYTLHVFNCPVHLSFDSSAGACNWPTKGPACQDDNLLV